MTICELIGKNRSYRRFDESARISRAELEDLVGLARLCPSGANLQPLKYALIAAPEKCAALFPHLKWAGALKDWDGPAPGERPAAYIVILHDTRISADPGVDHGIAAQSILLGATEKGYGGCMLGAIDRAAIAELIGLPPELKVLLMLALGKPAETVVIETAEPGGKTTYWRNTDSVHHVPKRPLCELIIN